MVKRATLLCLVCGCSYVTNSFVTNDFSGDPYPIAVDTTTGAVLIGFSQSGDAKRTAVLDILSPVTLADLGPGIPQSIATQDVTLLGERGSGGDLDLPRAKLVSAQVLTVHPCRDAICKVGTPSGARDFNALVGDSAFYSDALRLRLATSELFVLPDIGGDEPHRTEACDSVLPSPFRGGGTMIVGGTELGFTNWRIAIDACLAPNPDESTPQSKRGVNALLVASTAIGVSLLDESAYQRYRDVYPTAPPIDMIADEIVYLPSGPVTGKRVTIPSIALVANSTSTPRAPCRQVYAHHLLAQRNCSPPCGPGDSCPAGLTCSAGICRGDDCPCTDTGTNVFCGVPAIIELTPTTGIDVLVVADNNDTLQALRTELRPDRPEVDGILGTNAIQALELDIDYPHDRLLGRCSSPACAARPQLTDTGQRTQVDLCLGI